MYNPFDIASVRAAQEGLLKSNIDSLNEYVPESIVKGSNKHDFSSEEREKLAEGGEALPDGSFPIRNKQDLLDAIKSVGRAKDIEVAKNWIKKRASELSLEDELPESWVEKAETVEENLPELIAEHERLIKVLKSKSKLDDKKEAELQGEELETYKNELKKAFDAIENSYHTNLEKGIIKNAHNKGGLVLTHIINKKGQHQVVWKRPGEAHSDEAKHLREVKEGDKVTYNGEEHHVVGVDDAGYLKLKDKEGKRHNKSPLKVEYHKPADVYNPDFKTSTDEDLMKLRALHQKHAIAGSKSGDNSSKEAFDKISEELNKRKDVKKEPLKPKEFDYKEHLNSKVHSPEVVSKMEELVKEGKVLKEQFHNHTIYREFKEPDLNKFKSEASSIKYSDMQQDTTVGHKANEKYNELSRQADMYKDTKYGKEMRDELDKVISQKNVDGVEVGKVKVKNSERTLVGQTSGGVKVHSDAKELNGHIYHGGEQGFHEVTYDDRGKEKTSIFSTSKMNQLYGKGWKSKLKDTDPSVLLKWYNK